QPRTGRPGLLARLAAQHLGLAGPAAGGRGLACLGVIARRRKRRVRRVQRLVAGQAFQLGFQPADPLTQRLVLGLQFDVARPQRIDLGIPTSHIPTFATTPAISCRRSTFLSALPTAAATARLGAWVDAPGNSNNGATCRRPPPRSTPTPS